ncbi:ribonuclease P protein subunit [Nitrosopumilus sp.]|uniref:ribonuclease P protein component 1 n=1 Tax=Nitrosopumilus sp. TaxID=2024843 RepID=UPI002628B203|nr:ribonuclease P protein subunit [Nitrosopumilus sp.]
MITTTNITSHEFIGLNTKIVESSNPQIVGLNGKIINETKSMFTLNTENGIKSIAKANNSWEFSIGSSLAIVNGSNIQKRPFDRIGGKS